MALQPVRLLCDKPAGSSRLFDFDFSNDLSTGESINATPTITVTSMTPDMLVSDLTITGETYEDGVAQARIAGGTAGYLYHLSVTVTTTDNNTLVHCGHLKVTEC